MTKALRRLAWGAAATTSGLVLSWLWLTHRGVVVSATDSIPECHDRLVSDVEALLRPVLIARQHWDWGPNYDALEALFAAKNPKSLEARVALTAYDLGAHPDEELAESLLYQEEKATPLMRRYMQCRPPLEKEWLIGTVRAGRGGYEAYFELLKEGRLATSER